MNIYNVNGFIIGLADYFVKSEPDIAFSTSYNTTLVRTIGTNSFEYLSFCYLQVRAKSCPTSNPYFFYNTSLCYDICPTGTINNANNICV